MLVSCIRTRETSKSRRNEKLMLLLLLLLQTWFYSVSELIYEENNYSLQIDVYFGNLVYT